MSISYLFSLEIVDKQFITEGQFIDKNKLEFNSNNVRYYRIIFYIFYHFQLL